MMQRSPFAWKYLRVIEINLSKDTSEITFCIQNIRVFFKMAAKTHKSPYHPWEIGEKRWFTEANCNSLFYCMNMLYGPLGTPYPKWDKFDHFKIVKFTLLVFLEGKFFHILPFFSKTLHRMVNRNRH